MKTPIRCPAGCGCQTEAAVDSADVALFVIDARAGVVPLDEEIARWLRSSDTPIVLLANKAEGRAGEGGILESYALGFGDPIPFSAEHGEGWTICSTLSVRMLSAKTCLRRTRKKTNPPMRR
jgi:GTP-binding protein